jgi:hypothetical protein
MRTGSARRLGRVGPVVGVGGVVVILSLLAIFAGAGVAASQAKPVNTSLPTISGSAQEGQTLTGNRGTWTNNPTSYLNGWYRCDTNGGSCAFISGATALQYTLASADVGHTIRLRVDAKNADGQTSAYSAATAVVKPAAPVNTSPPTISGVAQEGQTLTGNRGSWTNNPTSYAYSWYRCDTTGGNCSAIVGAAASQYKLTSADVGNTLRFHVIAANPGGQRDATSVPTAVVGAARGPGCPAGTGNPDQISGISPPARLLVDSFSSDPAVLTAETQTLVFKVRITSTCGGPVQGAIVYATATPYNQFALPPEGVTGADGWTTLTLQRLQGFPVSHHQQLIAMFVRARKPGENLLAGISTRRLVSIRVDLKR